MNKTATTSLFIVSSFVLLTGFHGGCGSRDPQKQAERMERIAVSHVEDALDEVDASDAQKTRILESTKIVARQAIQMHQTHQTTKQILVDEWASPKPDAPRIHQLIDERTSELTRFLHLVADKLIDAHQTLTPEQRSEIVDELR